MRPSGMSDMSCGLSDSPTNDPQGAPEGYRYLPLPDVRTASFSVSILDSTRHQTRDTGTRRFVPLLPVYRAEDLNVPLRR
jgi:hypothetical protein